MTTTSSPSPTSLRTGLLAWAAFIAGLDEGAAQWTDEARRMVQGPCILVDAVAERVVGQDARTHELDMDASAGSEIVRRIGGPRVMTLALALDGYDQRLPEGPFLRMSRAATLAQGIESRSRLRALGLSLVDAQGPINASAARKEGGRAYPRAVLDVRLGYTRVELDAPTTWIERARLTTGLRDADGELLPSPPNREVEIAVETP